MVKLTAEFTILGGGSDAMRKGFFFNSLEELAHYYYLAIIFRLKV